MNGFSRCDAGPAAVAPDPRKRVNFFHGLVLGADDLTQESAYLANRSEWLARDLIGYGTVAGLHVTRETLAGNQPGLVVGSGIALSPRGRPINVSMAHAIALDDWLNTRGLDLLSYLAPGMGSPPGDLLRVWVVLAFRQCATDDRPGAGEPCRTDEPPRVFTRLADDFVLELRLEPPGQHHEDAVGDLLSWLRAIEIVDASPAATLDELLQALRAAAMSASPPSSALASPPEPLRVHAADAAEFFRAAFRVWTTELRQLWRTVAPLDDAVLLAEVELPITVAADGRWRIEEGVPIVVRDDQRPYLLPLRLVQELALARVLPAAPASRVEAAGIVKGDVNAAAHRSPRLGGLRVVAVAAGEMTVTFNSYLQPAAQGAFQYVVKATSHARTAAPTAIIVNIGGYEANGIRLRLADAAGTAIPVTQLATLEVAIEITRCTS
jgi:hypothetical protein